MLLNRLRRLVPGAWGALCCAVCGLCAPVAALAQAAVAPAAPVAEMTPAERAQRDANNVYHWILIHADKPRKAATGREDKPPAVVATVRAKPAARAAEPASAETVAAANAPALSTAAPPPFGAPSAVVAQPASTPTGSTPSAAAPVLTAAARPGAESLVVAVNLPAPPPTSTPTPAAVAAEAIDEALTPVFRTTPQFPPNLLRTLRKGQVQVGFTVLPDGSVAEPQVLSSSNSRLNPAALAAVAQWRFAPLQRARPGRVELGFDLD